MRDSSPPDGVRRGVLYLFAALALETALILSHFVYGAWLYDEPGRKHVVLPAVAFLIVAAALCGLYLWRRSRLLLGLLGAEVIAVYLGLFGGYHGGFGHVAKDLLFFGGMDPARLAELFDTPDFALPNDVAFELSGVASFVAALIAGWLLLRLYRAARRQSLEARRCA